MHITHKVENERRREQLEKKEMGGNKMRMESGWDGVAPAFTESDPKYWKSEEGYNKTRGVSAQLNSIITNNNENEKNEEDKDGFFFKKKTIHKVFNYIITV